jgi:uncharacterized protein YjdB
MTQSKRFAAVFLAVLLFIEVLCSVPSSVSAEEQPADSIIQAVGDFRYLISDEGAVLSEYLGTASIVQVPDAVSSGAGEIPVVAIGEEAFSSCTDLTAVSLPESITAIQSRAFSDCPALKALLFQRVPDTISDSAFLGSDSVVIYTRESPLPGDLTLQEPDPENPDTAVIRIFSPLSAGQLTSILSPDELQQLGFPLVTAIQLNHSSAVLGVGGTLQLEAGTEPAGLEHAVLEYASSDSGIASVDNNGLVTAKKAGTAIITVSAQDGSGVSASCKVTVEQKAAAIKPGVTSRTIYIGKPYSLKVSFTPTDTSNKALSFSSSNSSVASVSSSGTITGKAKGTAVITVKTQDGSNLSATVAVTVCQPVTKISLNAASKSLYTGSSYQLTASASPSSASSRAVAYSSSNSSVASVSSTGKITAKKAGTATITVSAKDGQGAKATCKVTVKQKVTSIKASVSSKTVYIGKPYTLSVKVSPSNATNKKLSYSSSNKSVATVSSSGKITAKKKGTAKITIKTTDGTNKKITVKVTVKRPVTKVKLSATKKTLNAGATYRLKATASPTSANSRKVTYSSSNKSVATVSSTGKIKAKKGGTAIITVKAKDGQGAKATCKITVRQKVTSIKPSVSSKTVYVGKPYTLSVKVYPSSASNKGLSYSSSNKAVATVSSSGKITPKKKGTAIITIKTKDGSSKKKTVRVTVKQPVTKITLNTASRELYIGKTYQLKATASPSSANSKSVSYSSSNTSVATVSSTGKITAKKAGKATITVKAKDGQGAKKSITITVLGANLTLNASTVPMMPGKTFRLDANLEGTQSGVTVKYSSSDTGIATVSSGGVITAKKTGTAKITVKASDGSISKTVTVTVKNGFVAHGVDASYANGTVSVDNWKKVKADGYDFAIIRGGFGRFNLYPSQVDKQFASNYKNARAAGLDLGVYHYSYAKTVAEAKTEAYAMVDLLDGKKFEYPIVYDVEEASQAALGAAKMSAIVDAYCSILEDNGYYVMVYSYAYFLNGSLNSSITSKYDIWLAHYGVSSPNTTYKGDCQMWQYTSNGRVNGLGSKPVDLNYAYVDYPSIIKNGHFNGY